MWGRIHELITTLLQALRDLLGGGPTWRVHPEVGIEQSGFELRVEYDLEPDESDLYLRIREASGDGGFLTMESVDGGTGEVVVPVGPLDLDDGTRYEIAVVTGDGRVRPESPVEPITVPHYPEVR